MKTTIWRGGGVSNAAVCQYVHLCVHTHMHVHWCAGTCVCMHVCVSACVLCVHVHVHSSKLGRAMLLGTLPHNSRTLPEEMDYVLTVYLQKWTFSYVFYLLVICWTFIYCIFFQLSIFLGGGVGHYIFFNSKSFLLPSFTPSFCLPLSVLLSFIPSCLSVPLLLSSLLLFYGKNIILWHYMLMYLPFPPLSVCSTVNFCYFSLGQLFIQQIFIEHLLCAATVLVLGVYQCTFFKCLVSLGVMFNFVSKKEAVISLAGSLCTWVGIVHWSLLLWNEQVGSQLDLLGGGEGKAIICMLLSGLLTTTSGTQVLF